MLAIGQELDLEDIAAQYGESDFPRELHVENLTPRMIVGSEACVFLDSNLKENGQTSGVFRFLSLGTLCRFALDMQYLAKLNDFDCAVLITDTVQAGQNGEESATEADTVTEEAEDVQTTTRKRTRKTTAAETADTETVTAETEVGDGN